MDTWGLVIPCACLVAFAGACDARARSGDPVTGLIARLGSSKFPEREKASQALEKLGKAAIPALKRAATRHADPEVRRRALILIARLVPDPERDILKCKLGHPPKVRMHIIVVGDKTFTLHPGDLVAFEMTVPPPGDPILLSIKTETRGVAKEVVTLTPKGANGGIPIKGKPTATVYVLATKVGDGTVRIASGWASSKNAPRPTTGAVTFKLRIAE